MGHYLNPDYTFVLDRIENEIYVDKSVILNELNKLINTDNKNVMINRPFLFGKTKTACLVTSYYSKAVDTKEQFSKLKIGSYKSFKKHLNKYNVIFIDMFFADYDARHYESMSIFTLLKKKIIDEIKKCYDFVNSSETDFVKVLNNVSEVTGTKFVFIIDRCDYFQRYYQDNDEIYEEYIDFLTTVFAGGLSNNYIALSYLTGVLPLKKNMYGPTLNIFREYSMISSDVMAEYTGFTDSEVKKICTDKNMDYNLMKEWYFGYRLNDDCTIYNPIDITDTIFEQEYDTHWCNRGTYQTVYKYIKLHYEDLKYTIFSLVAGESIKVNTSTFTNDLTQIYRKDDVLTYLIHFGYLSYNSSNGTAKIPNKSILKTFIYAINKIPEENYNELHYGVLKNIASKLLKSGIIVEDVQKITGLNPSTVEELENEVMLERGFTKQQIDNIKYFKMNSKKLWKKYGNGHYLISNKEVLGCYSNFKDAVEKGESTVGKGYYIVQEIVDGKEPIYTC